MDEPRTLTLAELGRTILQRSRFGTLSTLAARHGGAPYGSIVECLVDGDGGPVLFLSGLAAHTRNLLADPRASLLVTDRLRPDQPLADGRVSLVGRVEALPGADREAWAARLVDVHPGSARYVGFSDFNFYKLVVDEARFIAGFGRMTWTSSDEWAAAAPDPLAEAAPDIVAHMNADHRDALALYCQVQGEAPLTTGAIMTWVDRFGVDVLGEVEGEGERAFRFAFESEARSAELVRKHLVAMARAARQAG